MEAAKTISVEEVVALVEYIAKSLVDEPDAVVVKVKPQTACEESAVSEYDDEDVSAADKQITLELTVGKNDTGKVIGKQGRIAKAIRTVVRAATVKGDTKYRIDII